MLLNAVIIPPHEALTAVSEVLHSLQSVEVPAPVTPETSRFLRRRSRAPTAPPENAEDPELDIIPAALMGLPITGFGNVTAGDAARLADTIQDAAATWARPTVRLTGGAALEFPGDRSVWAKLEGDVDGLVAVASGVVRSVESRGFFVDRRTFRPWLAVATITEGTTAAYLERAVAALDAFRGEPWTVEWVSLTKPSFGTAVGQSAVEAYRVPLTTP